MEAVFQKMFFCFGYFFFVLFCFSFFLNRDCFGIFPKEVAFEQGSLIYAVGCKIVLRGINAISMKI